MPWITIGPGTIVMNLNASDSYGRFAVVIGRPKTAPNDWKVKFEKDYTINIRQAEIIPILVMDEHDSPEMPFDEIWALYQKRIHDAAHALFAQQTRNEIAMEEFRRFLPDFRSPQ